MESVERVGKGVGWRGKLGNDDCGFNDRMDEDRFTIGIVVLFVGEKGGEDGEDVHDCVGRWDNLEGGRDEIEGWWWIVARLIGITEFEELGAKDENAEERICVDGSNFERDDCTARIMMNAIYCQPYHFGYDLS